MKKISLLLLLIIVSCNKTEKKLEQNLEFFNLNGKINSVQITTYGADLKFGEPQKNNEIFNQEILKFNSNGLLISKIGEFEEISCTGGYLDIEKLKEKYPEKTFCLIMGGDNLATIDKWKNYHLLLEHYDIYVYNRPGYDLGQYAQNPRVQILDNVPMLDISATFIREALKSGKSVQYLVPEKVFDYLSKYNMYK